MKKIDLRSTDMQELEAFILQIGEKKFRAKQIFEWIHKKLVGSFDEMTNLSKDLREKLKETATISTGKVVEVLSSKDDGVMKYLFELENENIIESVLMQYSYGNTVCVSSQAGCRMGCRFCASTLGGLKKNLSAGEMLTQVYEIQKHLGERISNIVIMGSGEPFDNYDQVMKFIRLLNNKDGLEIGQRSITVSTCGLAEQIYDFTHENTQVNLAISLHAPNDEIRKMIMPINNRYNIEQLFDACRYYTEKTNRRITYEYALVGGVNDKIEHARELGSRLRHTLCHVNLINLNGVEERDFPASSKQAMDEFAQILKGYGVETTIRRKRGQDIDAACGQLRNQYLAEKN